MKVLLYGIARQELTLPSGRVLDLREDATWRRMVTSLRKQVPAHRPPLYREHDEDGPALGYVEQALPVTREQLVRAGVPASQLPHTEYVLFRARLNPRGRRELKLGDIARTSIGLAFDVTDDQGRVWPYFLDELSAVDKPHVRTQPTADELSRVSLRAGRRDAVRLSGVLLTRRSTMDDAAKRELLTQLASALGVELGSRHEEDEMAADTADDVLEELARKDEEDEEMAADTTDDEKLSARVQTLERELQAERLKSKAERLASRLDGVKLSKEERKAVIEAGLTNPSLVDTVVRLSASTATRTERLAAGGGSSIADELRDTLQGRSVARLRSAAAEAAARNKGGAQ